MADDAATRRRLRTDAEAAVEQCAVWHSRMAARRITRFLEARMASSGLGVVQLGLMCMIASAKDDTLGALARRADLDPSSLSRNLDALARAGLVEIVTAEQDRRRRAVWLTETGARKLEAALPVWREAHRALEAALDVSLARDLAAAAQALPLDEG